ncbi:TIGR01777 family oxidoreductase [Marinomonas ostreistagni]|uniref:TIGR01777 family oxidoreductase n=1 Tax=Marinomonas ostreistagni TaxID=359209 RepID=UPI00194E88B6|nr:TIGR01777 family oxidoreductase [Marinomonas ostreistagni]MBM6550030.1 TIGR01777 family oxidoreductase [Marinomonas ostreistagni]
MKVLITGANGFVATNLYPTLTAAGFEVFALIHKHQGSIPSYVQKLKIDEISDHYFDAIVNLAGAGIADKRWSAERQKELLDSRVGFTESLLNKLKTKPKVLLNASAVGYYGFDRSKTFTETTTANPGFTHQLCSAWEYTAKKFEAFDTRVVIFRLGVVLGHGGALNKMKWPYKLGFGSKIGDGQQYFPWIHVHDVCRFIWTALEQPDYQGIYNLVAPEVVNQETFSRTYAEVLRRPHLLTTPAWVLDKAMGDMGSLLTRGQKVVPMRLEEQGFEFEYPTLKAALKSLT